MMQDSSPDTNWPFPTSFEMDEKKKSEDFKNPWRHLKTGGRYEFIGHAQMQTDTPVEDLVSVAIYQGTDGKYWVRPTSEFMKRFSPLPIAEPEPAAQLPVLTDVVPFNELQAVEDAKDAALLRKLGSLIEDGDWEVCKIHNVSDGKYGRMEAERVDSFDELRRMLGDKPICWGCSPGITCGSGTKCVCDNPLRCWEPCGVLGKDERHVEVAPASAEKEVDDALGINRDKPSLVQRLWKTLHSLI